MPDDANLILRWTHVLLTVEDAAAGVRHRIFVGGPLVRPRSAQEPICDLKPLDASYRRWGYVADDRVVTQFEHDGSLGAVSCAQDDEGMLFVSGFRDARAGTAWILGRLEAAHSHEDSAWRMVRTPFAALRS